MSKPIFIMQMDISQEQAVRMNSYMKERGIENDYYVFILISKGENKFQMFSDHEIQPIELEKLKEIVDANLRP